MKQHTCWNTSLKVTQSVSVVVEYTSPMKMELLPVGHRKWNVFTVKVIMMWLLLLAVVKAEPTTDYQDTIIRLPEYSELRHEIPAHFRQRVEVLSWTPAYGEFSHWDWWFSRNNIEKTCPEVADRCVFTTDKQRLNQSDAVAFMTYSGALRLKEDITPQLPPYRLPHQRWIYLSLEPPELDAENENLTQLAGVFNWTMNYRRDADVFAPFGRALLRKLPLEQRQVAMHRDYAQGKTKLVAWFVSHCVTPGRRENYVEELQRHLPVDIWGACGPFKCEPPRSDKCYQQLAAYKFYLAFENTLCEDYVTEKFFNILSSDVIPVVFGGANYSVFAPAGSYINALDFASPKDLADFLLQLSNDSERYNRYFDWKRGYSVTTIKDPFYVCEMCLKLMDPDQPPKTYENIHDWWYRGGKCRAWYP